MTPRADRRRGFTVLEMAVVIFLTALLSVLLTTVWTAFAVPAMTAAAMCRLSMEAHLASAAIARDVSGTLPFDPGAAIDSRLLTYNDSLLTKVIAEDASTLLLKYNVNSSTLEVRYQMNTTGQIVRTVAGGATVVVAGDVTGFAVDGVSSAPWVVVTLAFNSARSGLTDRVYVLEVLNPNP